MFCKYFPYNISVKISNSSTNVILEPPQFLMEDLKNVYVDEVLPVPVDVIFDTLVGDDSTFMESHLEEQNAYGE